MDLNPTVFCVSYYGKGNKEGKEKVCKAIFGTHYLLLAVLSNVFFRS